MYRVKETKLRKRLLEFGVIYILSDIKTYAIVNKSIILRTIIIIHIDKTRKLDREVRDSVG